MIIEAGLTRYEAVNKEIEKQLEKQNKVTVKDVNGQRYIGCALDEGKTIEVYGTPASPLPVWTRLPYRPASPCCGSGWRAVRCCWPPTTVPPSTHWAGRCWSCRSWHSRVRLAIPQTKDYNKG